MKDYKKPTLNTIKFGEISSIFKEMRDNGSLFRLGFKEMSLYFLSKILEIDDKNSHEEVYNKFLESIDFESIQKKSKEGKSKDIYNKEVSELKKLKKDEAAFHKYICLRYLFIDKEPKEKLLETFIQAHNDIEEIDKNLINIDKQLEAIDKNNNALEIQQKRLFLKYYQELNKKAKKEILNFFKSKIYNHVEFLSTDSSLFGGMLSPTPYSYRWHPKSYKPKPPNDLYNKMGDLPIKTFNEVCETYIEDKESFRELLIEYIDAKNIIDEIKTLLDNNHLLNIRKEIILEALEAYNNESKIIFAFAIPTIIEGIFHDLCIESGVEENKLLQEGLQQKLNRLKNIIGGNLYYEYYSFRFRLLRNEVAHGRLKDNKAKELAGLLLLDLRHVCTLTNREELKFNQKLNIIRKLNEGIDKSNYKELFKYLLLDKVELSSFYMIDEAIEKIEKYLVSNEFWDFLENEVSNNDNTSKHAMHHIIKILKSRKPFDKRCTRLLRKVGLDKTDTKLVEEYIEKLKNY